MAPSPEDTPTGDPPAKGNADERRTFLVQASAIVIGGIVGFVPLLVGLWNFLNPLRRRKDIDDPDEAVRIATLDDIGEIGKVFHRHSGSVAPDAVLYEVRFCNAALSGSASGAGRGLAVVAISVCPKAPG